MNLGSRQTAELLCGIGCTKFQISIHRYVTICEGSSDEGSADQEPYLLIHVRSNTLEE